MAVQDPTTSQYVSNRIASRSRQRQRYRTSRGDRVFMAMVYVLVISAAVATLYPFLYIIAMSISDPALVNAGKIWLIPQGVNLQAYRILLRNDSLFRSYYNTIWYTGIGTSMSVVATVFTAFAVSRKDFTGRRIVMPLIVFTMFFSGGLIPRFILIRNLGLYNTRWAIVLPVLVHAWNMIIARTFFDRMPKALYDAATIDGCNDLQILFRIVIPSSKAIIAVLVLYYAVGLWNSYFPAILYLADADLHPVQVFLIRALSIGGQSDELQAQAGEGGVNLTLIQVQLKYALIIVVAGPIVLIYPFLQRYFVKGVMIGALKG